ncbi:MAG: hypothetical protein H8E66_31920 [Planctomycetes bacterium]|nr:hypothetical protein [Planctomycetota bacterium]
MTIKVGCSSCHAQFAAKPHLYGKTVACPNCQAAITVPEPSHSTNAQTPLAAVDPFGTPQQVPTAAPSSPGYRPQANEMDGMDKKVLWYSVAGAGGILLLLVGAIVVSRLMSDSDEPSVADAKSESASSSPTEQATISSEVVTDRPVETTAHAAPERKLRTGANGETSGSEKSQLNDETAHHTPATSTDTPFVRTFPDLSDRERKAFVDDFMARFKPVYEQAFAVARGGSPKDAGLADGKVSATMFVIMADHRIEPTELYRHLAYGIEEGWIREGEIPAKEIVGTLFARMRPLSPEDEALMKVIASISLRRRKEIIDEFNRFVAKYADPVHRREFIAGIAAYPKTLGITDEQWHAISVYATHRGWTS